MNRRLADLLSTTSARAPEAPAVVTADGRVTRYGELQEAAEGFERAFAAAGVRPGDRVGFCVRKSPAAVAAIIGVLRLGAAYVPVDCRGAAVRNARILNDSDVQAVLVEGTSEALVAGGLWKDLSYAASPAGESACIVSRRGRPTGDDGGCDLAAGDATASLLYTSGSTGAPKGVVLSHGDMLSFLDWCSETFVPTPDDHFASYAPFHFDLSVLDLFLSVKHGARLTLIDEPLNRHPRRLAALIADRRISVWYSTPTALRMLVDYGRIGAHDYAGLRLVLFAGEVFPLRYLRALKAAWKHPRFYNLYGPTETNVCTHREIPGEIPRERNTDYSIGQACSHLRVSVRDRRGMELAGGGEGELCVSGPAVMAGYWKRPADTQRAFFTDATGTRWYRSGDIVRWSAEEGYQLVGRRDRMVKRRGVRIELGEIEAALYQHPSIREVAAIARRDRQDDVVVQAYLSCLKPVPSSLALKEDCASLLPTYMIPDHFRVVGELPKTSTGKINYRALDPGGST